VLDERARRVAADHRVWVVISSFAGSSGGGYDHAAGGSGVWAPDGAVVARAGAGPGAVARATLERADGIVRTYLELDDPARLRPARPPRVAGLEIARVEPADGELARWFYAEVGRPYMWTDRLGQSAADWQAWAERVETWVATVAGERAGYYELRPDGDSVEVAHFGLLAAFHGQGLGGHLLTHALRRALEIAPRVWLHTNTKDGSAALPNYLARGLRPFRREVLA
jgi:GNAT superfamily N-acetyltransferase